MSKLLRGVFCVIETFHKYASEDRGNATMTCRELRQLLEGEIGNFLQPHVFHSVERKLNLLDTEEDVVISLKEYLLAVFSFVYLLNSDISLLNSEPRLTSKSEKMGDVEFQATPRNSQQALQVGPTQEKLMFVSEMASSAQPSHEEDEVGENNNMSPGVDIKTPRLPQEVSEPNDPENQQPEEDSQEVTQDVPATEYDGVQFKRNMPVEVSKQCDNPIQVIPKEGGQAVRRQSDTELSDHKAQRPSGDEEHAIKKNIKKHFTTQDPFPQKEDRAVSEHTDLPTEAAAGKPSQTQRVIELIDDTRISETQTPGKDSGRIPPETINSEDLKADRTSETHQLPLQERKHQTQNQSTQSGSRNNSETSGRGKQEEGRKEHEGKTGPSTPDAQTQHEECQEFSGSQENDAAKGSGQQGLNSEEGNQNIPEIKEDSITRQEARHNEEDTADALLTKKNSPTADETPGTRERSQELAPLEKQSQGKNHKATRTEKPVRKEGHSERADPESAVTKTEQDSSETPSGQTLEVGKSRSDSGESQVAGDLQTQADTHGGSKQGSDNSNPDPQKQEVISVQEDRQHPGEHE
ncbi:trichohyalin 1 [Sigmodon hispidus]